MARKIYFDVTVTCWRRMLNLDNGPGKVRSQSSGSIGTSSVMSTASKKREKIALARLKVNQLMQRHARDEKENG